MRHTSTTTCFDGDCAKPTRDLDLTQRSGTKRTQPKNLDEERGGQGQGQGQTRSLPRRGDRWGPPPPPEPRSGFAMPLRDATTRSRAASHLSAPCAEHKFPKRSGENPVRRRWERGMVSPFRSGCPLPFRRTNPRPAEGRPSNGRTPYTNAKPRRQAYSQQPRQAHSTRYSLQHQACAAPGQAQHIHSTTGQVLALN